MLETGLVFNFKVRARSHVHNISLSLSPFSLVHFPVFSLSSYSYLSLFPLILRRHPFVTTCVEVGSEDVVIVDMKIFL